MIFLIMSIVLQVKAQDYRHYHVGNFNIPADNPWVTNGGTCRTAVIAQDGAIKDCTLHVQIDNDSTAIKENNHGKIKDAMQRTELADGWYVAVPVEFDVVGDESIVDYYELCGFNHLKNNTYPVLTATDNEWNGDLILQEMTNIPTNVKKITKQAGAGPHHYNCYTIDPNNPINPQTGKPNYCDAPTYYVKSATSGDIVLSIYIKVYYNNGLTPTYHSINNVKYSIQKIVTAVDDTSVNNSQPIYYNLMGVKVENPSHGIFIQKRGNKTTKVIL